MPMATYQKTIQQLKDMNFSGELHLYAQNEPFLDVSIFEKIDYAHKQLPDAGIALISNFTVLNDEKIKKIIKSPIQYLSCSIYALKAEAYEAICGRDNFKASFINQVKFLKLYGENPKISFAMYLMNDSHNQDDIEFCEHFIFDIAPIRRADFYETFSFFNTRFSPQKHNKGYINHCIYDRFQIMGDGDVSLCSIDCGSALHVGNLHESTLSELLNSPQAIELRKRMLKDERKDAYCRYCEFGRVENKILYFLPIPQSLRTFLNKRLNPSFRDEHDVRVFSDYEIKNKLARFNEIFKDGDEEHWIECLNKLRESYYASKI
jgi:radical SAM protein with 4Fe4S-binding SPASM domain